MQNHQGNENSRQNTDQLPHDYGLKAPAGIEQVKSYGQIGQGKPEARQDFKFGALQCPEKSVDKF